jgi:hypothetical protein
MDAHGQHSRRCRLCAIFEIRVQVPATSHEDLGEKGGKLPVVTLPRFALKRTVLLSCFAASHKHHQTTIYCDFHIRHDRSLFHSPRAIIVHWEILE